MRAASILCAVAACGGAETPPCPARPAPGETAPTGTLEADAAPLEADAAPLDADAAPLDAMVMRSGWSDDDRPTPRCFAYAPALRAYACLGLVDLQDGETRTPSRFRDLVGPTVLESHPVGIPLARKGFTEVPVATVLPPDRWVATDRVAVRLRLDLHERDASFEYYGEITVRCADGVEREIDVRRRGLELGEEAILAWAPASGTFAVSVHGVDGGEGHEDHWINTVVVDVAPFCAGKGGIAGPILERSVGP